MEEFTAWLFGDEASLWTLLVSSFLASTILPGGSEVVLYSLLKLHPHLLWPALLSATIGNTLGAMTSYLLGRLFPKDQQHRSVTWLQRHGSPVLLLSWVPLIGDALCVAAGWLRINPWHAALFMMLGKGARYWIVSLAAT